MWNELLSSTDFYQLNIWFWSLKPNGNWFNCKIINSLIGQFSINQWCNHRKASTIPLKSLSEKLPWKARISSTGIKLPTKGFSCMLCCHLVRSPIMPRVTFQMNLAFAEFQETGRVSKRSSMNQRNRDAKKAGKVSMEKANSRTKGW